MQEGERLKSVFNGMSATSVLYFVLSVISLIMAFAGIIVFKGWPERIAYLLFAIFVIYISAMAIKPKRVGRFRNARISFQVFATALVTLSTTSGLYNNVLSTLKSEVERYLYGTTQDTILPQNTLAMVLLTIAFVSLLYVFREKPTLGVVPKSQDSVEFRYYNRRDDFCAALSRNLMMVDEALRWHNRFFVNLDAEIDVRNTPGRGRRVADLVSALKANQEAELFLVVGVPGSGKSVALRKACAELLEAPGTNGRIPVYVNLKEWIPRHKWSARTLPTANEFSDFVRKNIQYRLDDITLAFFDSNYPGMLERGELFFVFDSFDEIPGIMDCDETSIVLETVSSIIVGFIKGQKAGRGVIASRYFKRPRIRRDKYVHLDIRPFNDYQISQLITNSASNSDRLKTEIFKKRLDIGALARNPFVLSLIILYWQRSSALPKSQYDLFAEYINSSIDAAREYIEQLELDRDSLLGEMERISWAMFDSERHGLEMTVSDLRKALPNSNIETVVDALVVARLARKASVTQAVSFVHRRFNEFFLVSRWLADQASVPWEAIPTDSRFRDALVLYAEVADEESATKLAECCWAEIQTLKPGPAMVTKEALRGIFSLRFLAEAFRVRQTPLKHFQSQLGEHVLQITRGCDDLLSKKIVVEAVGLLSDENVSLVIGEMFTDRNNAFLRDGAFIACRYLRRLSDDVITMLSSHVENRPISKVLFPENGLMFSLRISEAFSDIFRSFQAYRISIFAKLVMCSVAMGYALYIGRYDALIVSVIMSCIFVVGLAVFTLVAFQLVLGIAGPHGVHLTRAHYGKRGLLNRIALDGFYRYILPSNITIPYAEGTFGEFVRDAVVVIVCIVPITMWGIFCISGLVNTVENSPEVSLSLGAEVVHGFTRQERIVITILLLLHIVPIPAICQMIYSVFRKNGFRGVVYMAFCNLKNSSMDVISTLLSIRILNLTAGGIIHFIDEHSSAIGILSAAVFTLPFLYGIVASISVNLKDSRALRLATVRFNPRRSVIANEFSSFQLDKTRVKYVHWLEKESFTAENAVSLSSLDDNPWPGSNRPNLGRGESNFMLAMLDARWLGIDPS